jgi:hypothetical protein
MAFCLSGSMWRSFGMGWPTSYNLSYLSSKFASKGYSLRLLKIRFANQ